MPIMSRQCAFQELPTKVARELQRYMATDDKVIACFESQREIGNKDFGIFKNYGFTDCYNAYVITQNQVVIYMHSSSNSYPNQESLSSTRLIDIDNVSEQVAAKLDFRVYATNNSGGNNTYCYFVSQQAARQFSEILRQAIREAKTSLASTSQSTQTNAKRCNQCGANNPPDNAFCGKCGSALTKKCSRCGTVNDSGFKFCGVCGTPLGNP